MDCDFPIFGAALAVNFAPMFVPLFILNTQFYAIIRKSFQNFETHGEKNVLIG